MKTYVLIENDKGQTYLEMTEEDGTVKFVPCDTTNSDYQAYLASQKEEK